MLHQHVEDLPASGAVDTEQANRLWECQDQSGHLPEFRQHSRPDFVQLAGLHAVWGLIDALTLHLTHRLL